MCLSPITIPSQTKYVSLRHCDKFLMEVPCGKCAECQKTNRNQWYYRAWYEYNDLPRGGYCLFDTLTYRNKRLPHLSDTWTFISPSEDFSCFNYQHIRQFIENLRIRLKRAGYGNNAFRYFAAAEYGSIKKTMRPHYHLMLYVHNPNISPVWLSRLISKLWKYGRTDGIPYKSHQYVMSHNVVAADDTIGSKLRTCSYVTKYIQKSCVYQDILDKRINKVMWRLAEYSDPVTPEKWLESELAHREKLKLLRYVNQFHRQSQHFGESALGDLDLKQLFRDGCLYMPDQKHVSIPIPLPTYYKRKLFQQQVWINGSRYWQLTDYGKEYVEYRRNVARQQLINRYTSIRDEEYLKINPSRLADYVLFERGRLKGDLPESTLEERVDTISLFNYSCGSDKLHFNCRGLSPNWQGDSQQGYLTRRMERRIPLSDFISKYVYTDSILEKQLQAIELAEQRITKGKQSAYSLRQRLENLNKDILAI